MLGFLTHVTRFTIAAVMIIFIAQAVLGQTREGRNEHKDPERLRKEALKARQASTAGEVARRSHLDGQAVRFLMQAPAKQQPLGMAFHVASDRLKAAMEIGSISETSLVALSAPEVEPKLREAAMGFLGPGLLGNYLVWNRELSLDSDRKSQNDVLREPIGHHVDHSHCHNDNESCQRYALTRYVACILRVVEQGKASPADQFAWAQILNELASLTAARDEKLNGPKFRILLLDVAGRKPCPKPIKTS